LCSQFDQSTRQAHEPLGSVTVAVAPHPDVGVTAMGTEPRGEGLRALAVRLMGNGQDAGELFERELHSVKKAVMQIAEPCLMARCAVVVIASASRAIAPSAPPIH
jgi:hypothetical protein